MASTMYLSLNEKPRVILDVMRRIEADALKANRSWNWGCTTVIILAILGVPFLVLDMIFGYGLATFTLVSILVWALAAGLAVYIMITGRASFNQKQFQTAATIILNLRDDVAGKGRITGWLDLTGPRQKSKIARTGRSRSGNRKIYYRDTWLQFKSKLVDGNVLRIALTEQQKVKKGSVAGRRMKMKARIVFNPELYRLRPFTAQEKTELLPGDANLIPGDGVVEITGTLSSTDPDPWQVLNALKAVYDRLDPIGHQSYASPAASTGTPPSAAEATA